MELARDRVCIILIGISGAIPGCLHCGCQDDAMVERLSKMNAAVAGMPFDPFYGAKEVFASYEGKVLLQAWGIDEDVEGIGFCILGHAEEEKPKTEIIPGRVFYV